MVYSDKRRALTVRNAIAKAWADTGWENGRFGYPTGEHYKSGSDTRQNFSGGVLGVRSNGTSYWLPSVPKLPDFTVTGAGWGHGVGMSQYGARAMAEEGRRRHANPRVLLQPGQGHLKHHGGGKRHPRAGAEVDDRLGDRGRRRDAGQGPHGPKDLYGTGRFHADFQPQRFPAELRAEERQGAKALLANKVTGKLRIEWEGTRAWPSSKRAVLSIPKANAESSTPGTYRHGILEAGILDDQVNLVTSLRLNDEYLYGLAEVPSSWPGAVLQAQAIAGTDLCHAQDRQA